MNFLVNYSSDDEKEGRMEGSDRKYKPDATKNEHQKLREHDVDRKNTSSRGKKDNSKPVNKDTTGYRSTKNQEKERKQHHTNDDDKGKDRRKEYHNYRSERHKDKSKDFDRDRRVGDYDSKRREHHSYPGRYEKCRKEKRHSSDDHHHRRRRSISPKVKREYNERESNRKCKESSDFINESTSHKNIETKEQKNNVRDVIPTVSTTLLTTAQNTQPLKSFEQQPEADIKLPSYYNASVINPNKFAEQVQKRKLLWANKKDENSTTSKWGGAKFAQDSDGKVASKFMRLMGIKSGPTSDTENQTKTESNSNNNEHVQQREDMFSSMEQQYEVARQVTHTMRGVGLGFSSQNRPF